MSKTPLLPNDGNAKAIQLVPSENALAVTRVTTSGDLTLNVNTTFIRIVNRTEECVVKYATGITDYTDSDGPIEVGMTDIIPKEDVTILSFAKEDGGVPTKITVYEY